MACWEGLSADQQTRLIEWGNLPIDYRPEGNCPNGAVLEITTMHDKAPGPRFYCLGCAIKYLRGMAVAEAVAILEEIEENHE